MIDTLLFIQSETLPEVLDAIDIYEGSIPPSATFQVVDIDNTTEIEDQVPTGVIDVN